MYACWSLQLTVALINTEKKFMEVKINNHNLWCWPYVWPDRTCIGLARYAAESGNDIEVICTCQVGITSLACWYAGIIELNPGDNQQRSCTVESDPVGISREIEHWHLVPKWHQQVEGVDIKQHQQSNRERFIAYCIWPCWFQQAMHFIPSWLQQGEQIVPPDPVGVSRRNAQSP